MIDLDSIKAHGGIAYLGSPYSKHPRGIFYAYREVCRAAAWLINHGVHVYCPIAHCHPIAIEGRGSPTDNTIWEPLNDRFVNVSACLIVCMLESWQNSDGLQREISQFSASSKPIFYMNWPIGEEK